MISEFLLNIAFGFVEGLLNLLPDISWNVNSTAFDFFMGILKVAGYLFPWDTVVAIAGIILSLSLFRIVVSVLRSIMSILPFV